MGKCGSKLASPPQNLIFRTSKEVYDIIKQSLNGVADIHISDGDYACYSLDELKRFLKSDDVDSLKYYKDRFDCDNFALALAGREAEWFAGASGEAGSAFGIVHGDIRKSEDDKEPRPHAINFFIDDKGELWLIEPQTDAIFKPTSNSKFWFTLC